ncbi:MAG: hypothetical protein J0H50_02135 [Xanthomonadales bacterium]|nr:hypothetical protein [Xanthomonadales bacterium]
MNGVEPAAYEAESDFALARRLAAYVRANPRAGDTSEGITQWWLGLPATTGNQVQRALASLQAAGLIEAVGALDGHVRYRRPALDAQADAELDCFIATSVAPGTER